MITLTGETLKITGDALRKVKDVFYLPGSGPNENKHIITIDAAIGNKYSVYSTWNDLQDAAAGAGFPNNPDPKIAIVGGNVELYTFNVSDNTRMAPDGPRLSLQIRFNMVTESSQYNTFIAAFQSLLTAQHFTKTTTTTPPYYTIDLYNK